MKLILIAGLFLTGSLAFAAGDAKAGAAVYDAQCKKCHAADGASNPTIAKMMKVELKDLKAADVKAMPDADMKKLIVDGKGKMKAIKGLSDADIANVIAFTKSLK